MFSAGPIATCTCIFGLCMQLALSLFRLNSFELQDCYRCKYLNSKVFLPPHTSNPPIPPVTQAMQHMCWFPNKPWLSRHHVFVFLNKNNSNWGQLNILAVAKKKFYQDTKSAASDFLIQSLRMEPEPKPATCYACRNVVVSTGIVGIDLQKYHCSICIWRWTCLVGCHSASPNR